MSCYFVAQILIKDKDEYQRYINGVDGVFSKFNGKYLAVDRDPEVLEGDWSYDRVVIIQFPNEEDLRLWYDSTEYQTLLQHRLKAAKCDTLLVRGLD